MDWEIIDTVGDLVIKKWKLFLALSIIVLSLYSFSDTLLVEANQRVEDLREYYGGKITFADDQVTIEKQDWTFILTPVEEYTISGVAVAKKSYRTGDPGHLVSPMDIAIAWGDLAKPDYLKEVKFWMGERYYFYSYYSMEGTKKISMDYIKKHSSNNHIIPANEEIQRIVSGLKIGDEVTFSGRLVNINGINQKGDTFNIKTSRSRSDSGPGSCEIIFVENISVNSKKIEQTFK